MGHIIASIVPAAKQPQDAYLAFLRLFCYDSIFSARP